MAGMHAGADKKDDSVRLGQTYTYTWHVRERSGPGPKDPSSVVWMYHSHHSEVQDTNTGLYGAMIISAQVGISVRVLVGLRVRNLHQEGRRRGRGLGLVMYARREMSRKESGRPQRFWCCGSGRRAPPKV